LQDHPNQAISLTRGFAWRTIGLIFFAALMIRLGYISFLKEGYYFSDFRHYEQAALSLLQGNGFGPEYDRPPLYPMFIAGNYRIWGRHFVALRIMQALLGAVCSAGIFLLTGKIFGDRAGKFAGWISVFYPYYIFISGLLYPTLLNTFLLIAVIYFLLFALEKQSVVYLFAASFCLGLGALSVTASFVFLPFLLIWLFFITGFTIQRKLVYLCIILFAAALPIAPWILYNHERTGAWSFIDARGSRHLPYFPKDPTQETERKAAYENRVHSIIENPGKFIRRTGQEFLHFWSFVPDRVTTREVKYREQVNQEDQRMVVHHPFTSRILDYVSIFTYGPVFILAIVGMAFSLRFRRTASLVFLLLMSHAIGYSFFFTQVRYRLPVEFCLMIFAGWGWTVLLQKIGIKPHKVSG
jgi:4-amino-4-deoxy-L-arabinose transferase-like glycosyltransferase